MTTSVLGLALLGLALIAAPCVAFVPIGAGISTHVSITGTAVLQKVSEACETVAKQNGYDFKPTGNSPEELVQACLGPTATGQVSGAKFHSALQEIYTQNGLVDKDFVDSDPHHFNSETFNEGRGLISEGMASIKANVRQEHFQAARETLGRVLHTLQDFYSHSNWVELGYTEPYQNLIIPGMPLENLADLNTPTCEDCESGSCPNQLLSSIMQEKKLTSGYMGVHFKNKPKGKCSHGGKGDLTSTTVPRGGIHKDMITNQNVALHKAAVNLATTASLQLLEDIRLAVGDKDFLRMMGIARSSVVVFVIDTTGSMSDDIAEARKVVFEIIDSKKGTQDEPSEYILVPFNDPDFGPLSKTEDPDKMKKLITDLTPRGGGDIPEMCLSALQLALTGAPSSSHIYVFTDAVAKDISLKDTIIALIRRTKSTVSFFMTGSSRRRRRSASASFNDYREMAAASGGQAIEVSKKQLPEATAIIRDTSTSALVTILQRTVNPGSSKTFEIELDESLQNVTIYITGQSITYTLTNPAGVTQSNTDTAGKLGTASLVGNLVRIRLNDDKQTGKWKILTNSAQPYAIKVTGQSIITFIYNFVERFEGPHPGYAVLSGRPRAGEPAHLLLSVIGKKGPSSMAIGEIGLISGVDSMKSATTTDLGGGDILAMVDTVPEGEFLVIMTGTDKESSSKFQRQSTTSMSVSKVNIQAKVPSSMEPGVQLELPFIVKTEGPGGEYTIMANNDRDFPMVYPKKLTLATGKELNDTVKLTPPGNTPSGTDVTLTMEARSADGADSNYIVLRLSVVKKITDFVEPHCKGLSVKADDCPKDMSLCAQHQWEMTANLTDHISGTGITSISLRQGNGSLTASPVPSYTVVLAYNASCCSQIVEVVAVDEVGNVGKCYHSIARSAGPPLLTLSLPLWLCLLVSIFVTKP